MTPRAVTRGVAVEVEPAFLADQSSPADGRFVWSYTVRIANVGAETVQLVDRHWRITDSRGVTREVRGPGVVGAQPILRPGESYEYTSGAPLPTPSGMMAGSYGMVTEGGTRFEAAIPAFSLDSPHETRRPN